MFLWFDRSQKYIQVFFPLEYLAEDLFSEYPDGITVVSAIDELDNILFAAFNSGSCQYQYMFRFTGGYGKTLCGKYSISTGRNVPQTIRDKIDRTNATKAYCVIHENSSPIQKKKVSKLFISKIESTTICKVGLFWKPDIWLSTIWIYLNWIHMMITSCCQCDPFIYHVLILRWSTAARVKQTTAIASTLQKIFLRKTLIVKYAMKQKRSYISIKEHMLTQMK